MASRQDIDENVPAADVEMEEQDDGAGEINGEDSTAVEATETQTVAERVTFQDYLQSPIVSLVCGQGDDQLTLTAHQLLLMQSPVLAEKIRAFSDDQAPKEIDMAERDVSAVSSFLEFLYRKDYFPALTAPSQLEDDPSIPEKDDEGTALLRHARVYTLAQELGLPVLATLAHKKIHLTASSARGECAYARFIYKNTSPDDETIRKPVASFWATRSHVLRHSAEAEFRSLCLEFPQFGFDVLQMVLDMQEKKMHRDSAGHMPSSQQSGRKRARVSQV